MRPLIGVLPLLEKNTKNLWINPLYFGGVLEAGGLPVLLPLYEGVDEWETLCARFDGFLFTGGQDVEPALYGEKRIPECGYAAPERDGQELWMLRRLLELDKPILGICRGCQMLNVAAGGTMYQDLPAQHPSEVLHAQMEKIPYDQPAHEIVLKNGSRVSKLMGAERFMVNSMHHQAVKIVAPGMTPVAFAPDNVVEAVESPDHRFAVGVQWHPEFLWKQHPEQLAIFRGLVSATI